MSVSDYTKKNILLMIFRTDKETKQVMMNISSQEIIGKSLKIKI